MIDSPGAIAPSAPISDRWRSLAERASDLMYRYQLQPNIQCDYVNPAIATVLGYTPDECYDDPELIYRLIHPDDKHLIPSAVDLFNPVPQGQTLRYLHRNGSVVWLERWCVGIYDMNHQLVAVEGLDRDITSSKWVDKGGDRPSNCSKQQPEEALRESEEKFRQLAESIRGAFWMTNADATEVLYISPVYDQIWGSPSQELYQQPMAWLDAVIPEDRERVSTFWQQLPQESYEMEYEIDRPDGKRRWILDRGFAIYNQQGELYRMGGILEDITERKHLELALKQREEEFRALAENLPDIVARFDRQFRHTYVNPIVQQATGLSPTEFVGKTNRELGMPSNLVDLWEDNLKQVFDTGRENTATFEFDTPKGYRCYQSCLVPEFDADGTVDSVLGITRDITELKQAEASLRRLNEVLEQKVEERTAQLQQINEQLQAEIRERQQIEVALRESEAKFRQLAENIQEVFWMAESTTYHITYVSPAYQTIWGMEWSKTCEDPQEWFKTIHPSDRQRVETAFFETANLGLFDEEYRIQRPDGSLRWIRDRGFPVRDEAGHICRIAGIAEDITDHKLAEEKIKASLLEKETLLKEIHHRVKNNLQIVSSLLRLQSRHTQDGAVLALFQESQHRVQAMALIHEQLYQTKNLAQINLNQYIQTLVSNLVCSYSACPDSIQFHIHIEPHSLQIDTAIPVGLIINELISNALKYAFLKTQPGDIWISLTQLPPPPESKAIASSIPPNPQYCLSVKDNGVGLPPDLDINHTKSLGLQLVCLLTKQLHGQLTCDRAQGTEFRIAFAEVK
jgi:PAS domain S-box-containing protein